MIRVLLADDQALVRAGFAALLDAQDGIEVVGQAADGTVAVRLVREVTPDVVLMEIRMPGWRLSAWRPGNMAPTVPGGLSPAIMPESCFSRRC